MQDRFITAKDLILILDFLKPAEKVKTEIKDLIKSGKVEDATDELVKLLGDYQSKETAKQKFESKVIEKDLEELKKEEVYLAKDFDVEFDKFYKERYEKIDRKLDEEYERDMRKMEEIDQRVRDALEKLIEKTKEGIEKKKIEEIRKQIKGFSDGGKS